MAAVGGEFVLYGLIILSIIGTGITIERLLFFARHGCKVEVFVPKLAAKLEKDKSLDGALKLLKEDGSEEANIVLRVMEWHDSGRDATRRMMDAILLERRPSLEKGTMFLGTVGNNAPFIGLFGTVLGVVQAFEKLGANAGGGSMDGVMSSIGEALIATAVGIIVAIPAVVAFNILSRKAVRVEENAEMIVNLLVAKASRLAEESTS
jgi:biopolymer transport protein ExbB/TolQ